MVPRNEFSPNSGGKSRATFPSHSKKAAYQAAFVVLDTGRMLRKRARCPARWRVEFGGLVCQAEIVPPHRGEALYFFLPRRFRGEAERFSGIFQKAFGVIDGVALLWAEPVIMLDMCG
jgi:hypothetical protein